MAVDADQEVQFVAETRSSEQHIFFEKNPREGMLLI